uniref:Uncharacterized protein n=1 Tax=Chenopodium quinoa TaxID=63459 RepID=A0A803N8X0_CHEQI
MSPKTANEMRWHSDKREDDGVLRHPADSEAWKHLDKEYPTFSAETQVNEVIKKADQAIEDARKEAETARTEAEQAKIEAEQAKKEAEAVKNDVDRKIADNNAVWEKKFSQLLDFLGAGSSSDSDDLGSQGSKE